MEHVRATPEKKTDAPGAGGRCGRLLYVDNLRWTMILLVISMHAADTYSPFGNWYFVERPPVTAIENLIGQRNAARTRPYEYLLPSRIPSSTNI